MKATHDGECQLCGRLQKLPDGRLAKHGYTTRWGFFQGTCPGSDELPYEQSADLIAGRIGQVDRIIADLLEKADRVVREASPAAAWVHEYFDAKSHYDRGGYKWVQRPLIITWTSDDGSRVSVSHVRENGKVANSYSPLEQSLESSARRRAGDYAETVRAEAKRYEEYRSWLQVRLAAWTERPLREAVRVEPNPNPKPRRRSWRRRYAY